MPRKTIVSLLILCLFGLARWPLESARTRDWKQRHVLPPELNLGMRERLGQNSYAAAMGGARSFVASIQNLRAFVGWENQDWGAVEKDFRMAQDLQPRVPSYWELGAWHMAYNASGWYQYDWMGPRGENNPAALAKVRRELRDRYIHKGLDMFADGVRNNPEDWHICELAGLLAGDPMKLPDKELSAKYYGMAAALPDAPLRVKRFEAYALSYVPARRAEALAKLASLYQAGPQNHVPTLLATLFDLQLDRGVDAAGRVPLEKFGANPREIYQQLAGYADFRKSQGGAISPALAQYLAELEIKIRDPQR